MAPHISPSASVKNSKTVTAPAPHQATFHSSSLKKPSTYEVLPPKMIKKKKVKAGKVEEAPTTIKVATRKVFCQNRFDKAFKAATVSSKPSKAYNPLPF